MKIKLPKLPARPPARRPAKLKLKAAVARAPARRCAVDDDDDDTYDEPGSEMKLSHAFVVVLVLHVIAVAGVFAFNTIKARQAAETDTAEVESAPARTASATVADRTDPAPAAASATEAPPLHPIANAPLPPPAGASAAPAAKGPAPSKTHEVRPGDTLTRISSLYGVSVAALEKANAITDPTSLRPGQILAIPAATAATAAVPDKPDAKPHAAAAAQPASSPKPSPAHTAKAAPNPSPAATGSVKSSGELYTVVKGDNPVTIAKKFKVRYNDLISLNHIDDPRKLQIGQKLKIPTKTN